MDNQQRIESLPAGDDLRGAGLAPETELRDYFDQLALRAPDDRGPLRRSVQE